MGGGESEWGKPCGIFFAGGVFVSVPGGDGGEEDCFRVDIFPSSFSLPFPIFLVLLFLVHCLSF